MSIPPQYPGQPYWQQQTPTPPRPDPARRRRTGKRLTAIAGAILVLAAVCAALAATWFMDLVKFESNGTRLQEGTAQVARNPGEKLALWVPKEQAYHTSCTATGPDGSELLRGGGSATVTMATGGREYQRYGTYETTAPGVQTFTCEGYPEGAFVGEDFGAGRIVGGVFTLLGAVGGGIVGLVMLIVGLGLWSKGRTQAV